VIRAAALLLALMAPADTPETVFSAPEEHRLVEGIATDGDFIWLSSVLDRVIMANTTGMTGRFIMPRGTLHPMGLAWDAKRGWLWVATDCPDLPGVAKCDSGALVALDRKGRLKAKVSPGSGFHPGDVSADRGQVFVSDSLNGAVYRLNGRKLDTLIAPGVGRSAQGTALTPDGKSLVVADYGRGVAVVNLATKTRTLLPMADGKPLRGIDGLVRAGDDYYTVYNGSSPASLIRFRINGAAIEASVVHRGAPLNDPTQLALDGKRLLVVADAGWPSASKPGAPPRGSGTVVAFPLK
jgi:DNA-binding beta-propeller fold protein YncE